MNKEFIPYEQALELKELGFDEPCFGIYYNKTKEFFLGKIVNEYTLDVRTWTPLYQQAFKWFREKHGCHHTIQYGKKYVGIAYSSVVNFSIDEYETYEEAELACLKKLIEIVKNK